MGPQIDGMYSFVCHTPNCENNGVAIIIASAVDAEATCGPCGKVITDITKEEEEVPE